MQRVQLLRRDAAQRVPHHNEVIEQHHLAAAAERFPHRGGGLSTKGSTVAAGAAASVFVLAFAGLAALL